MTRALSKAERKELARDVIRDAFPSAKKAGYGRLEVDISRFGDVKVTAEIGGGAVPDAPLDV